MRACLIVACLAVTAAATGGETPLHVPFHDGFAGTALDPAWTTDAAPGNSIAVKDGAVEIRARQNTFAHIERPLGADFVRASCAIRPAPAVTWCTSLFVEWDAGNGCQLGVTDREGGHYYALEMVNGKGVEFDLGPCPFDAWNHVAIELGSDCIRYLSSEDGKTFRAERVGRRPGSFAGIPSRLVVGKGHGGPQAFAGGTIFSAAAGCGSLAAARPRSA